MNKQKIQGVWTALITPFKEDGSIDYESFDKLVDKQLDAGIIGLVISGTTGESPTLNDDECVELIKRAKERVSGRCLIMAGTGTNNTEKTIMKTIKAEKAGADMIILVNPYYNKPTQEGLYRHFKKIAELTKLPVILYNIKGRTGVNLETETLIRLATDVKNIVGVKEASGDLKQIKEVCDRRPEDFVVLSGDDNLTFQMIKDCGADGVISVTSNILPKEMIKMVNFALSQEFNEGEIINKKLEPLFKILFIETNPIPIKYASYEMGLCKNVYRLPMCEIGEEHGKQVKELLKEIKLL